MFQTRSFHSRSLLPLWLELIVLALYSDSRNLPVLVVTVHLDLCLRGVWGLGHPITIIFLHSPLAITYFSFDYDKRSS